MPKVRPHIFKASLTVLVLLCLGVGVAVSVSVVNADPEDYDTNGNGILEKDEVLAVVIDYFRDRISKDDVLEVLVLYFLSSASPEPTPTPTQTATPTPTPTSVPEPTQTPTLSQEDVTAPELVEITIEPSEMDTSAGAATITITAKATDDLSGIRSMGYFLERPSGRKENSGRGLSWVSGSSTDGMYVGRLTLPQYSERGTWRISTVYLYDEVGNHKTYRSVELADLGLSASFEVVSSQQDITPPELVEITIEPSEMDTSAGAATITITAKATDDLSGIRSMGYFLERPSGMRENSGRGLRWVNGSSTDGTYVGRLTLPQYSEKGTWRIYTAYLYDEVGNSRDYRSAELADLGLSASFEVVSSQQDITPPELVEITIEPSEMDTSAGAATITITAKATDDLSGIRSMGYFLERPSGMRENNGRGLSWVDGSSTDGMYAGRLTLPQYSEGGTWRISTVYLYDEVGNHKTYRSVELAALGLSTSFEVVSKE